VSRNKSGNSKHGKTSILELLLLHNLSLGGVFGVHPHPVNGGLTLSSSGGLSLKLHTVFVGLDGSAEDYELSPPLKVGLSDGGDGVIDGYCSFEGSEPLGEYVSYSGKHGGTSVGEFALTGVVSRDVITDIKRIPLYGLKIYDLFVCSSSACKIHSINTLI